jgi:hypothetical protein
MTEAIMGGGEGERPAASRALAWPPAPVSREPEEEIADRSLAMAE